MCVGGCVGWCLLGVVGMGSWWGFRIAAESWGRGSGGWGGGRGSGWGEGGWVVLKGTVPMKLKTTSVAKSRCVGVRGIAIGAGLACAGWLAPVVVASPAILDWLPTDASVVIASKPLSNVEAGVQALGAAIQAPVPIPTLAAALAGAGITDGIDTSRSVGVVMYAAFGDEGDEPEFHAVQVVGTTDYGVLVGNFGVQPGGGIDEVVANGEALFIKRAGEGYAALSSDRATLERFSMRAGNKGTHEARMGASGRRMASDADVVVIVDIGPMREQLKAGLRAGAQQAAQQAAMFGGEVGGMDSMMWVADVVLNDAETVIATTSMSGSGVVAELGVKFMEGSRLAGVFARPAAGGSGLDRLPAPDQGYFLAFTADTSSAGMKGLLREFSERANADGGGMQGVMLPSIEKVDGISMVVGASPSALFGGGVLINTVTAMRSSDPAGLRSSLEEQYKSMDGMEVGGATMSSTFTRNATEVNGKAVDEWATRMRSTDPMLAQTMMMMYGPSGPGGYVGRTESGVVLTMSRNSQLLGRAMDALEGRGSTLGQMDSTRRVMANMPEGRVSEALVGVQGILDVVRPMLGMMGAGNVQLPTNVPPVAMTTSAGDGTARLTLSVPAEVLQAGMKLGGAFGGGMAPGGAPGRDGGTGQPMF